MNNTKRILVVLMAIAMITIIAPASARTTHSVIFDVGDVENYDRAAAAITKIYDGLDGTYDRVIDPNATMYVNGVEMTYMEFLDNVYRPNHPDDRVVIGNWVHRGHSSVSSS